MHEASMFAGGDRNGIAAADERLRDPGTDAAAAAPAPVEIASAGDRPYYPNRLFHIPGYWTFMAPTMAMSLLPALAAARVLPGIETLLPALAAILASLLTPAFMRIERQWARGAIQRGMVILPGIALPMLLYGIAAATWARGHGDAMWIGAVGMATLSAAAASLLLARRSPAMLVALAAVWLPQVVACNRSSVWLIFGCGVFGGGLLVLRQKRIYDDAIARRHEQQRVQERAFDILVDYEKTGQGWFWETDQHGRITYLSPRLGDAFGCPVEALYGRRFAELFGLDVTGHESAATSLNFHFSTRSLFRDMLVSVASEHEERWWSISGSPVSNHLGDYSGFRGFGWDQTEKRRLQERSSRLAHYDSLTGVANRLQMSQSLETILNASDESHRRCAIFLIDLDRFKQVNDTFGHPAGDAVLREAAERLRRVVDGAGRVGRLGGDEFQVILPGAYAQADLAVVAERMVCSLGQPYEVEGQRASIGGSIGIALAPADGVTSETLMSNADLALYAAKDGGRGRFQFFVPDLRGDAEERRQLVADLREAVATGGLELWYQPVIHLRSQSITGFEALLRWEHPRLGRLSPGNFVPIAEEAGLIGPIGEWALRTACRDLANWPESVRVAVNLSPLQFANPALPAIVTNALAAAQVAAERLELDITESVFLNEDSSTEAMFAALKRIGVRLALDDFGTGYSSLGYLEAAPFDCIKIDQSLLRGAIAPGSRNGAILASIVGLADALGMETTAEGVETDEELELARIIGCSHVQGFLYEPPMSLADTVSRFAGRLSTGADATRFSQDLAPAELNEVIFECGGLRQSAAVRSLTVSGAVIQGTGQTPPGAAVTIHVADGPAIRAHVGWFEGDCLGVDFVSPLRIDEPVRSFASALALAPIDPSVEFRRVS